LRVFSFGGYGLALAALALVVFGAYDSYPSSYPNLQKKNVKFVLGRGLVESLVMNLCFFIGPTLANQRCSS